MHHHPNLSLNNSSKKTNTTQHSNSIHKSIGIVKPQTGQNSGILENSAINNVSMAHMLSKRSGLKTSNEEMTMFSRKMDSERFPVGRSMSKNEAETDNGEDRE